MDTPLLDTHIWIWWMGRDARLGNSIIEELDAFPVEHRPYLSDISLTEVALLTSGGRLSLPVPLEEWLETAAHPRSVRLVPISPAIAARTARLGDTFRDPSDPRHRGHEPDAACAAADARQHDPSLTAGQTGDANGIGGAQPYATRA